MFLQCKVFKFLINDHLFISVLTANGERSKGAGNDPTMSSSVSCEKQTERDKQAPIKGDSYLAMIESAFQCAALLRFGDDRYYYNRQFKQSAHLFSSY